MEFRNQAEQLALLLPPRRLHPAAWNFACASAERKERWLVALSGGADSAALLCLLWAHFPAQRIGIIPVHFNHRLRGAESDSDESFCRALGGELGLTLRAGAWNEAPAKATEDEARRARYSFFECMANAEGADVLFTGHQKDDIVETQLMRLARGASAAGLAAPRPARPWLEGRSILRPLLTLSRSDIQEALCTAGVRWREDSSNAGDRYFRNRVRASVVPAWLQASGTDALQGAALTREWMEEDDVALESVLDELGVPRETELLDLRPLAGKTRGLWRRALRRWIPGRGMSWSAFDHLLTLCMGEGGRCSVGSGFAIASNGTLRWSDAVGPSVEGAWTAQWMADITRLFLPDGGELHASRSATVPDLLARLKHGDSDSSREVWLELPDGEIVVRSWIQGDRYRPLGAPGTAKLQDLFVNRKIPVELRTRLPVLCRADGRILWVPGLPPADDSKLDEHSVTAVQLTYIAGTSTVQK